MSEQKPIHRRQEDLATASKSLGSLAAKALQEERLAVPNKERLTALQKELLQNIADSNLGADAIRAVLESAVSVLRDNGMSISDEFLGISRVMVCVRHHNEEMRETLLALSNSESSKADQLLDFLVTSTEEPSLPRPNLALVLTAIRHQVSRFGKLDEGQIKRLNKITRRYPRFGSSDGEEIEYFKGGSEDISYAEQTIELLCELARYEQRRRLVLASSKQSEQDVSIAPKVERIVSALSMNGRDQEIAYQILQRPPALVEPVLDLYLHIHKIKKTSVGNVAALSETIRRLHGAGITALFLARGNASAPGRILSSMWEGVEQIVSSSESLDISHLHGMPNLQELNDAINITALQAFSGVDEASEAWRKAWLNMFPKEIVDDRLSWDVNKPELDRLTVRARLSPYARLMFDEAVSLDSAMLLRYSNGEHFDGGLVCLAYMRVLEIQLNHLVYRMLNSGVRPAFDSSNDFSRNLNKGLDALITGASSVLTMGQLRDFFGHVRKMTRSEPDAEERLSETLTDIGVKALRHQQIADCISSTICEEFRNPPAHASFVDWGVVDRCRQHVIASLLALNGHADASGQQAGWVRTGAGLG